MDNIINEGIKIIDIILRSILSVGTLFFMCKIMGRKQMSQLSMFDYTIGISIGSIAAAMALERDTEYLHGITAIICYALIDVLFSYISRKSMSFRRFTEGSPILLIDKGKLIHSGLINAKYDLSSFLEECRTQGYFDISEIEFAISESNGKISIMPNRDNKPVTAKDLNLPYEMQNLTANIIIDGKIMKENLDGIMKNEEWLYKEMKKSGYKKPNELFLATADILGNIKFYPFKKQKERTILN